MRRAVRRELAIDGQLGWMQKPDKELSRTLITLLEAVEMLPKIEAAVIANYPHLLMQTARET